MISVDHHEESRKEKILEAAAELFMIRGYRGFSTRDVAEISSVPLTIVKRLFPRKRDMLIAAMAETGERYLADLKEKLADAQEKEVLNIVLEHIEHNPFTTMAHLLGGNAPKTP